MEYDQIMNARISVVEACMAALEQRLATLEQGTTTAPKRRRKELTPEDRVAIRARLVAGQQKARKEREAAAAAGAKKAAKDSKKETKNGASTAEN